MYRSIVVLASTALLLSSLQAFGASGQTSAGRHHKAQASSRSSIGSSKNATTLPPPWDTCRTDACRYYNQIPNIGH